MADKKKVYSIVINGLQESVDMVESLNNQLKELDKTIKAVEKRTIKIKGEVEVDTEKTKTVVSGGGSTNTDTGEATKQERIEAEKLLAVKKQISAEEKAEAKLAAMTTDEYKESYKAQYQAKEEMKQMKKELEAAAAEQSLLNDSGKQYANTMAGMKQELKNLKTVRDNLDLAKPEDVQRFKEIQERCLELETLLKSIESEAGVFSRNVGNYPQLLKQATTEWENIQKVIASLSDKLSKATPGTEGYDKLKSELEQAEKYAKVLDERLGEIKDNLNDVNRTGIKLDIAGKEREFNSLKDAVKTLTKELQEMTLAGQNNTEEFKATIVALGKVKTAMASASGEIKSYVGNAKALSDTVEIMQGLSGIASIGVGLQGLFGGKDSDLDESLRKFAQLTLVMQGLQTVKKQLEDTNSLWSSIMIKGWDAISKSVEAASGWIGTFISKIGELTHITPVFSSLKDGANSIANAWKVVSEIGDGGNVKNLVNEFDTLINSSSELKEKWDALGSVYQDIFLDNGGDFDTIIDEMSELSFTTKEDIDAMVDFEKALKNAGDTGTQVSDVVKKLGESYTRINKDLKESSPRAFEFAQNHKKLAGVVNVVDKGFRAMSTGIGMATTAVKAFAKATIVFALVQGLVELLSAAFEALGNAFSWTKNQIASFFGSVGAAAQQTQESVDSVTTSLDMANDRLTKFNKQVDRLQKTGVVSSLDAMSLKLDKLGYEASLAGLGLQKFITTVDNLDKALGDNLDAIGSWYESGEKSVNDFIKRWETLRKAVEAGTDEMKQETGSGSWWYTASDAVDDFTDANKAMLQDLSNQIQKIDFSKPEQAVKAFDKLFQGEIGNARDYAYRNIDKLFPEEPWAQMLKARLDATKTFLEQYRDLMQEAGDTTAQMHRDAAKAIRDATTAALPQQEREREQLKNQRADEIEAMKKQGYAVEDQRKLEAAINAKYDRMEKERHASRLKSISKSGDNEYSITKQIRDNLLSLQAEGLEKEKQKLKNAMADELKSAEKAGKRRGELEKSIVAKYQKKIEDLEKDWYKNQLKQREAFNKELIRMAQQTADELVEIQNTANLNSINRGLEENENQNVKRTTTISYDTSIDTSKMSFGDNDKLLDEQKKYYDELLKAQSEYIAKKTQLQLEESLENERQLKEQAEREYNQRLASNKEWQEAQLEQLNKFFKEGLIGEEEYNQKLDELTNTYENSNTDVNETYQQKLSEITKNGEQERNNIVSEGRQEQQNTNAEANQNGIDAIQSYYDEITDISEREQKKNMNRHTGLFNYAAEKERLEKVKAGYEKVMTDLEADYEKLKAQYNAGDIDFDQFQAGKKQIESLKKAAEKSAEDTSESLSDLFQNYAQSINDYASKIASQFQDMFSTFQNIQSLMLDAEQAQLDQEEKILDRQKDAVEKAYDKQAEIVEKYRDAINNTEDELKNARGERRLALLDSLAQQREAYLQETETLKKQELEKEKIARKEEQLKDKQDALEKKRKKQQQAASIINATINTALGVTQALASWPPPASYALAAAVGALGAVEIALIASQKYAKGGLLEGDSHKNGGITLGYNRKGIRQEAEGGEYIVNKQTTTENLSLIEFVNSKKRRLNLDDFIEFYSGKAKGTKRSPLNYYADGGQLGELTDYSQMINQQPLEVNVTVDSAVSVVDIMNAIDRVTQTKVLAGLQ